MENCMAHQLGCGCRGKCRSDIMPPKAAVSRWPERLALVGFILSAALGLWAGGKALEPVDRAYQLEARM